MLERSDVGLRRSKTRKPETVIGECDVVKTELHRVGDPTVAASGGTC